ncbi:hypothetical protein [Nannocystis punicea]|uniref:Uncharacterized protein n=1 Tax=Nannocystis punicea TaxID=2995304 RepID=A0ABY7GWP8_9BACT|nr:hypothetical protein [Nannocystis poenicansa]WAS91410.1 hypothetical protein O0S08_34935 [Nannocystis poenicansa]
MKQISLMMCMLCGIACGPGKGGGDDTSESGESSSGSTGASSSGAPTTGSETTDAPTGSPETEGEPEVCVPPIPGSAEVSECEIDFCPPASWHVVAHNEEGTPGLKCDNWSGSCDSNTSDYQAYMFESEDLVIYLSFEPQLADEHSDASFKANFDYLWAEVRFPPDPSDHSEFYEQTDAMHGLEIFDSFTFEDGRLKASLHLDVDSIVQRIASDHPECISGDISGECSCTYTGLDIPVTIDIDLTVDP